MLWDYTINALKTKVWVSFAKKNYFKIIFETSTSNDKPTLFYLP